MKKISILLVFVMILQLCMASMAFAAELKWPSDYGLQGRHMPFRPEDKYVSEQNTMRISTGKLNDILADATARVQPPSDKGKRLKIYYATQASTAPPTFVLFVNDKELFHFSYLRYIENQIRTAFDLTGTPVKFIIRERNEDEKK